MPSHVDTHITSPPPSGAAPVPRPKRRKRRWIIGGTVAAGSIAAILLFDQTVLTHTLLSAQFTTSAAPFQTHSTGPVVADVVNGAYRMRATTAEGVPTVSQAPFERVAYAVVLKADVVGVTGPGASSALIGISCRGRKDVDYALLAAANGSEAALLRAGPGGPARVLAQWTASTRPTTAVHAMALTCAVTSPTGSSYDLTGTIDGVQVLKQRDAHGPDGISGAALMFQGDKPGTQALFDNVTAEVP